MEEDIEMQEEMEMVKMGREIHAMRENAGGNGNECGEGDA